MAEHMISDDALWEKIDARAKVLKTRRMKFLPGHGEAVVRRSKSGKTYSVSAVLRGYADGPMVFDILQNKTAMTDQLIAFMTDGSFSKAAWFRPCAAMPTLQNATHEDAIRFAEYVIGRWDEFLSSYPDLQTIQQWVKENRTTMPLPYWIPASFVCQN